MLLSDELLFLTAEKSALSQAQGDFARQLAVIALEEPNPAASRDFLSKVLTAANLNLNTDTLFAEIPVGQSCAIAPDLQEHAPKQVLVFGLSPTQLGLSIDVQAYDPIAFYGCTWLFADRLSVLEPDKVKKGQLWAALKQIFL